MVEEFLKRVPLQVTSSRAINDGVANFVIEVNNDWIFRFSRRELTRRQMVVENKFLPKFEATCPILIPHIEYSGEDFMGYKKIPGTPLKSDILTKLPGETQNKVARDLGSFLSTLHTFSFDHPDLKEFPYGGEDFWNEIWSVVSPLLSKRTATNTKDYFEEAFLKMHRKPSKKVLTHSDLGTSNILFNNETQTLGVIDFGDLCIHDPARDFNGLLRNHGRAFTERVLSFYTPKIESNFWDRIDFYAKRQNFMVIYYAPLFGFEEYIPTAVQLIEKLFG